MAFNIVARIDDLLYVNDLTKHSDRFSHPLAVSVSGATPHKAATFGTTSFSPAPLISPARGEITSFLSNNNNNIIKPQRRGFGVRRVLSNYLGVETKATRVFSNSNEVNGSNPSGNKTKQPECQKESCSMKSKTK